MSMDVNSVKILYAVNLLKPWDDSYHVHRNDELFSSLKELGFDLEILTRWGYPHDKGVIIEDEHFVHKMQQYPLHLMNNSQGLLEYKFDDYVNMAEPEIVEMIKKISPDIVISTGDFHNALPVIKACKKIQIPVFYDMSNNGTLESNKKEHYYDKKIDYELQAIGLCDGILSPSDSLKKWLIKHGISSENISHLPISIKKSKIQKVKRKKSLFNFRKGLNIGFRDNLNKYSRFSDLLISVSKFNEKIPKNNLKIYIEGNGIYKQKLEEEAKKLGLDKKILFLGKIQNNSLESFYQNIDISVIPNDNFDSQTMFSNEEILRSMAFGIPVIASDTSPNLEYIQHGINGLLYDSKNPNTLNDLLMDIHKNKINLSDLSLRSMDKCRLDYNYQRRLESLIPFIFAKSLCVYGRIKPLDYGKMNNLIIHAIKTTRNLDLLFSNLLKNLISFGNSREVSNALTCLIRNFGKDSSRIIINSLFSGELTQLNLDYRHIRDLSTIFNRCTEDEIQSLSPNKKIKSDHQKWALAGLEMGGRTSKAKLEIIFKDDKQTTPAWQNNHDFEIFSLNKLGEEISPKSTIAHIKEKISKFNLPIKGKKQDLILTLNTFISSEIYFEQKKLDYEFIDRILNLPEKMGIELGNNLIKEFFPLYDFNRIDERPNKKIKKLEDLRSHSTIFKKIFALFKDSYGPIRSIALEAGYIYYQLNPKDDKFNIVFATRVAIAGMLDLALEIESSILQRTENQDLLQMHIKHFINYKSKNLVDLKIFPIEIYRIQNKDYWMEKISMMLEFNKLEKANQLKQKINLIPGAFNCTYDVDRDYSKKNHDLWLEITGHCEVSDDARLTSGLLAFEFFDNDYQQLKPFKVSGLSRSQKVGWYSYFKQDNKSGFFKIKLEIPKKCSKMKLAFASWHKPKNLILEPNLEFRYLYVKSSDDIKSNITFEKLSGKWLEKIKQFNLGISSSEEKDGMIYLSHMALPFENNGYCTRTHGLISNLKNFNKKLIVESRYGYPRDKSRLRIPDNQSVKQEYIIDGIRYRFDPEKYSGFTDNNEYDYIFNASVRLAKRIRNKPPEFIQAASNYINGAIGMTVAKAFKIPLIYEVRGLWHLTRLSRQPDYSKTKHFFAEEEAEISICKEADIVLAITHAVRYYLIDRGVDESKVFVLPNGVDLERFQKILPNENLRKKLKIPNGIVIGYAGSFVSYEGLDLLIRAFARLAEEHANISLLLVGDGDERKNLEDLTEKFGMNERVFFTGKVPHDSISDYLSLIDIAPFPRKPKAVCELVSPLKPFESMAMGHVVVASDVAALQEIITEGKNGKLFKKGDENSLYETLNNLVTNPEEIRKLSKAGNLWVKKERNWAKISEYLYGIHSYLISNSEKPRLLGTGRKIPIRNGLVMKYLNRKPNLMVIMDEFSKTALSPDANIISPKPDNCVKLLNENSIDALLVESAWVGNNGSWHRKVGWYGEKEISELKNLLNECNKMKIPTIFYNKEDPIHFSRFSKTSALFDYVFTTDEGSINSYMKIENSKTREVQSIQFAAQPSVHHPYGTLLKNRDGIAFAGTYYSGKYDLRCSRMNTLFTASVDNGLIIYDRQSDGENPQYVFPERFREFVRDKLEYTEILDKHREHLIFLNVNSVEDSRTMASRRIFEIPASGACLVSGPGLAVREVYGNIIPIVETEEEAKSTINSLIEDENHIRFSINQSRRLVLRNHLNKHRLEKILSITGIILDPSNAKMGLKITDKSTPLLEIYLWLARQTRKPEIIIMGRHPKTLSEKIMEKMLKNQGIKIYQRKSKGQEVQTEVRNISGLDHNFLDFIWSEKQSIDAKVKYTSEGKVIAIIHGNLDKTQMVEHFKIPNTDSFLISTNNNYNFKSIPKTILIAGHDLKFAEPIMKSLSDMGIEILVDKWSNHTAFDEEKSRKLLEKADAVWCEWALGNVEWYTKNTPDKIPIYVRYHLQERNYDYLNNSNKDRITHISFVCDYYLNNAIKIKQISKEISSSTLPNVMDVSKPRNPKNDNFAVGFVGLVPARKRLDKAIDLIEKLVEIDQRYTLKIVGKKPEDYAWIKEREHEKEYFASINKRLDDNPELKKHIQFLGFVNDIDKFYSSVGHVISTSDFESFHLTLADGPINGAAGHTLPWKGSESIYTSLWIRENISQMAEKIHDLNIRNKTAYHAYLQTSHLSHQMQPERIALSILEFLSGDLS